MKSFGSAFDRMGNQGEVLATIEENTRGTKESVSVGGALYDRIDALTTAIEDINEGNTKAGKGNIASALATAIVAPAMEPIGKGFQLIVDAINALEGDGKDTKMKMEALTGGLVALGEVGKSILLFAGYMLLATPILLVVAAVSPLIALSLFAVVTAVMISTRQLDKKQLKKIAMLKQVGLGILAVMGALALSSLIIMPALKGLIGATIVLLGIALIFTLIPKSTVEKMSDSATSLSWIALGILGIMVSLALTSLIIGPALKGFLIASMIIVGIGLVFWALESMGIMDKIEDGAKGLLYAAGAILGLGIALALFNLITPPFETLVNIAMVVGAVAITFGIVGIFSSQIEKGAKAMLWAALSILALGISIGIFTAIVGNITGEEAVKGLAALIVIGVIGAGFYLAGTQASFIAMGAGAMILAAVSIILLGVGVMMLTKALGDNPWTAVGATMALIGGVGLAMGAAGLAAIFIAAGAGAMILAGVALITVGAGMMILKKLDFKALTKKGGVLGDSGQKTKGFFGIGGGRPKTNMEVMFEAIADSFSLGPLSILAIYAGAPAFIMAGMALLTIGKGIAKFQKIAETTDLNKLGTNVNMIVFTLANTFGKIGTMFPGGKKSLIQSIFGGGKQSAVADGISSTMGMGSALTGIARGMQAMANLKFPIKYDKEGNPIEFESMDSDAPARVAANAAMITGTLATVFGAIGLKYPGGKKSFFASIFGGGKSSPVQEGIQATMGMGDALTGIAKGFQAMANLNFPVEWDKDGKPIKFEAIDIHSSIPKVQENTQAIVTGLSGVFAEIGKNPDAQRSWFFGRSTVQKGIDLVASIGTPLFNLAKGVQAMANLRFPTGFDKDGKATGYETISSPGELIKKVSGNTQMLIQALVETFTIIGKSDATKSDGFWWWSPNSFEKGVEIVTMIAEPYEKLGKGIKDVVDIIGKLDSKSFAGKIEDVIGVFTKTGQEAPDPEVMQKKAVLVATIGSAFVKMSNSIPGIVEALNQYDPTLGEAFFGSLIRPVDEGARAEGYGKQATLWATIGANVVRMGESMPTITESINNMDLAKLTEMRTMFEALGVLSNGAEPSDILAAMGESLEEALENLATMLEEFKGSVEAGTAAQTETGGIIGNAIKSFTGGGQRNTSNSGGGNSAEVVAAINQLQTTLVSSGIKVKKSGGWFD